MLWLQAGACSGNTISLLQAEEPTVVDLLTDFGVELLLPAVGKLLALVVRELVGKLQHACVDLVAAVDGAA